MGEVFEEVCEVAKRDLLVGSAGQWHEADYMGGLSAGDAGCVCLGYDSRQLPSVGIVVIQVVPPVEVKFRIVEGGERLRNAGCGIVVGFVFLPIRPGRRVDIDSIESVNVDFVGDVGIALERVGMVGIYNIRWVGVWRERNLVDFGRLATRHRRGIRLRDQLRRSLGPGWASVSNGLAHWVPRVGNRVLTDGTSGVVLFLPTSLDRSRRHNS